MRRFAFGTESRARMRDGALSAPRTPRRAAPSRPGARVEPVSRRSCVAPAWPRAACRCDGCYVLPHSSPGGLESVLMGRRLPDSTALIIMQPDVRNLQPSFISGIPSFATCFAPKPRTQVIYSLAWSRRSEPKYGFIDTIADDFDEEIAHLPPGVDDCPSLARQERR